MLKLNIEYSNHFKKDYRLAKRRGFVLAGGGFFLETSFFNSVNLNN